MKHLIKTALLTLISTVILTATAYAQGGICIWGTYDLTGHPTLSAAFSPSISDQLSPAERVAFCGCTWGQVLVNGEPVEGAEVTLTFRGQDGSVHTKSETTAYNDTAVDPSINSIPFYQLSGWLDGNSGARRGDVMTLTATYAGQTMTRTIRALPDNDKQEVSLAFTTPFRIESVIDPAGWSTTPITGYNQTMAFTDDTLWLGGTDGILARALATNNDTPYPISNTIRILPTTDTVYALTLTNLYGIENGTITDYGTPPTINSSEMAFNDMVVVPETITPTLMLVGRENTNTNIEDGFIAQWDGAWTIITRTTEPATDLIYDADGSLWVSVWEEGVYRYGTDGMWEQFTAADGLASDAVYDLAIDGETVYFATQGAFSDIPLGGVSVFDPFAPDDAMWDQYTSNEGLPNGGVAAAASTYSIASTRYGDVIAGSDSSLHWLDDGAWVTVPLMGGNVIEIAAGETTIFALNDQLHQFTPDPIITPKPIATISSTVISSNINVTGTASAYTGTQIVGWEWRIGDTILCTEPSCTVSQTYLPTPITTDTLITLTVFDDTATYATLITTTVSIASPPLSVLLQTYRSDAGTVISIVPTVFLLSLLALFALSRRSTK